MRAIEIEPMPTTGDRYDFRVAINNDSGVTGSFAIQMTGSVLSTNWSDGQDTLTAAHRLAEALTDAAEQPETLASRVFRFSTYTAESTFDSTIESVRSSGPACFEA